MDVPAHPNRSLFVNIPVSDLDRSIEFFTKLGFTFNPLFTDETATCMLVGEQAYFMIMKRERFLEVAKGKDIGNPAATVPAMYAFDVESRERVDELADIAEANGGTGDGSQDHGFMYSRAFRDPDGHYFEVLWMDPVAAQQGPAEHGVEVTA